MLSDAVKKRTLRSKGTTVGATSWALTFDTHTQRAVTRGCEAGWHSGGMVYPGSAGEGCHELGQHGPSAPWR